VSLRKTGDTDSDPYGSKKIHRGLAKIFASAIRDGKHSLSASYR
jgi:hypothetical protein